MRHQPPRLNPTVLKHILRLIFLLVIPVLFSPSSVWAQTSEVVPQIVTLFNETQMCGNQVWRFTLEIWNVGSDGGDAYAQAIASGYDCVNGEFGNVFKKYPIGTFSGGPNGILTTESSDGTLSYFHLVDGKAIIENGVTFWTVQNPEAFDGFIIATPQLKDCTVSISLPPNLKPGDDIWMTATYADLEGAPIASDTIISEAWIINGKAGALLTTWDGKAMEIELQYTCPDGQAHSSIYNLPAFTEEIPPGQDTGEELKPTEPKQAPPDNPPSDNNRSPLVPLVLIAGALVVGGGALVGAGAVIYAIVKSTGTAGGKHPRPVIPKATVPPPTPVQVPPPTAQPPMHPKQVDRPPHFDYPKPPTQQEISNLRNRRAEMEGTIEEYKHEWQETHEMLQRLQRMHKKNLIKRMFQLGLETQDIVGVKNPTGLAKKILSIPLEEAIGKPSPEQETKILLDTEKLIQNMKGRLGELQENVKYLRNEVRNIDKKLGG